VRDDFNLIIDTIATNSVLTSEIIRYQDTFSRNSLQYLTLVRDNINKLLLENIPHAAPESVMDVADFLSGLHAFRIKLRVAYIKKRLPHFSKWFVNAMATNNVIELFEIEQKLNTAQKNLLEELAPDGVVKDFDTGVDESQAQSDFDDKRNKLLILDSLKTIHSKSNRTVSDLVKKYFDADNIENLEDVMKGYASD
jgi:hypothetical protein